MGLPVKIQSKHLLTALILALNTSTLVQAANYQYRIPSTGIASPVAVANGGNWVAGTKGLTGTFSVAFGNSKFVTVQRGGSGAAHSTDGVAWLGATLPSSQLWQSVAFGNGRFVAVANGPSNAAAYSADGAIWSASTLPASKYWAYVTFGNGLFVAIDSSNAVATSPDGVTWSLRTLPVIDNWHTALVANGKLYVFGQGTGKTAISSDNGLTWSLSTRPSYIAGYVDVTYGNGKFVAGAYASPEVAAVSTDGVSWTQTSTPLTGNGSVTYGNGKYVAVAYNSNVAAHSLDGVVWTASTLPEVNTWTDIVFGSGKFVTVNRTNATTATTN